jgi:hypothetical protein
VNAFDFKKENEMKIKAHGVLIVLTLLLSAFIWSGCTRNSQLSEPSDADIMKAIDDSGIMKQADGRFTVVPPATVVQKGQRNKDGSWPVKVKFTVTFKMADGRTSSPTETTTSFRVFRAKDDAGKSVWKAQLGS